MLGFGGLLAGMVNASDHTKCISLNNQPCMEKPTPINLNPDECNHGLHYYQFTVNSDRCNRSCNAVNDTTENICVLKKTENIHFSVFNVIAKINELLTLAKHISCKCKCKFDGRKRNSNQKWNNDKC